MSEQGIRSSDQIASEMARQVNFGRDRAKVLRESAVRYFRENNIAMAYRCEGGAAELESMAATFDAMRVKIALGESV